jgi:AsmA protein
MRRVGVIVAIVLALVIVAAAVFLATFDVNRYRGAIESQLEQRLGRKVTLGEMRLNLIPLRIRVRNLAVADDPAFAATRPFVQAKQLDVTVRLLPLLEGNVEIESLALQQPIVELIKNQQGLWNFSTLGEASQQSAAGGRTPSTSTGAQPQSGGPKGRVSPAYSPSLSSAPNANQFSLANLTISDGQVAVTDLQANKPRAVYDHISATVRDFAMDRRFSFDLAVHLPGAGTEEIQFQGKGGPIVRDEPAATPVRGTLDLMQVEIAALRKFLDSPALATMDGVLTGRTKISSTSGTLAANGKINLQNARLNGRTLGYPITADYDISDNVSTGVITIRNTTVTLGTMPLLINGTADTKPTPAQINLQFKAANVSIAEAAKLAAASGTVLTPGASVTGNISAILQAQGAADKPALSGSVSGRNIQISGKSIPQPVQVKSINVVLTPAEIRSDSFNVSSGGTTVAVQFALRQYLAKSPMVDATLRASGADLPGILSMAKAYGVTALDNVSGAGKLNVNMRATGPLQTLTSAAVVRTLNGSVSLNLSNVRYSGIDIAYELASIGGFLKPNEKNQGFTNISHLTGNILVKNGVARTDNLLAQLDIGNVGASGTANLVNQALDLRVMAVLSKDFSQRVGGAGIGGYLNTALANNQGELVIPAIATGTLQNTKFSPDLQKIAQMKLKGLVPSTSNPLAGVSGILGGLLGKKGATQTQQQQQQPPQANPVQQLLNLFGKKKKQKQPQTSTPPN